MRGVDEILEANEAYARAFDRGGLEASPARKLAVVTCMDARIDPLRLLGLDLGDAHVIRNAGGLVTDDALRSLALSHWLLGTQEALVIGHTDCGAAAFGNDELRERVGPAAEGVDFLPVADVDAAVRAGVRLIEESPLLPAAFGARGFVYDVADGRLHPVREF